MSESITIDIEPIGKPRMTKRDKWHKRPSTQRYWNYKEYLNLIANKNRFKPSHRLRMTFYFPVTKSWSKKKQNYAIGQPHQQTPDIDNCAKGILDAFFKNDSAVYEVHASKYWANEGSIVIENLNHGGTEMSEKLLGCPHRKEGEG